MKTDFTKQETQMVNKNMKMCIYYNQKMKVTHQFSKNMKKGLQSSTVIEYMEEEELLYELVCSLKKIISFISFYVMPS